MAIATISKFLSALKAISLEEVGENIEKIHKDVENMITAATESTDGIPGIQKAVNEYLESHWLVPALFWVKDNERLDKIPNEANSCCCGLVRVEVAALLKAITGSPSVMVSGGEGPGVMYNTLVSIYRLTELAQDGIFDRFHPFGDIDIGAYRSGDMLMESSTVKDILDLLLWVITQANASKSWNTKEMADTIRFRFREIKARRIYQYLKFETREYLSNK